MNPNLEEARAVELKCAILDAIKLATGDKTSPRALLMAAQYLRDEGGTYNDPGSAVVMASIRMCEFMAQLKA